MIGMRLEAEGSQRMAVRSSFGCLEAKCCIKYQRWINEYRTYHSSTKTSTSYTVESSLARVNLERAYLKNLLATNTAPVSYWKFLRNPKPNRGTYCIYQSGCPKNLEPQPLRQDMQEVRFNSTMRRGIWASRRFPLKRNRTRKRLKLKRRFRLASARKPPDEKLMIEIVTTSKYASIL